MWQVAWLFFFRYYINNISITLQNVYYQLYEYAFRDIVIPKSRAIQQRRMRTETSVDSDDDDAFFDSEDDDEDQDESK